MKSQILKLADLADAPARKIIGLMSGTSLDGLDIALCEFKGSGKQTEFKLLKFTTIPYKTDFQNRIKKLAFQRQTDLAEVTLLHAVLGNHFAELILDALHSWGIETKEIDLIASHGQTIFHAPRSFHQLEKEPNATLQLGDADHIALRTGIITLSDFRQKHIAAGGEGAPLVFYGDSLLFTHAEENRILLNIGGISNLSWLPAGKDSKTAFSTDIGPGNTLMDQYISTAFPGKTYDKDAALAASGTVQQDLLTLLLTDPFFSRSLPRTTGPEYYNLKYLDAARIQLKKPDLLPADVMATLCAFSAKTIVRSILSVSNGQDYTVYMSGGGMHNPLLVNMIRGELKVPLHSTAELGYHPDAKEAILFALLANECIAGDQPQQNSRAGIPAVTMGKISLPG